MNTLYYGDNLHILRNHINDESVDLIYLDPPFNSKRDYNAIFDENSKQGETAQIMAFQDTWHWTQDSATTLDELRGKPGCDQLSKMLDGFVEFLGRNDATAYLAMMAPRLVELHRVLKPTGSLYLHCDPTMGHYLKVMLDQIFGKKNFCNEVVWSYRRWPTKQQNFQQMHDTIFRYSKTKGQIVWNQLFEPLAQSTLKQWGEGKQDAVFGEDGKRKRSSTLQEKSPGAPMRDVWDIPIIAPMSKERLGYPTQKPIALLRRIVEASSNAGDVILDPFCGCGTTLAAAQETNRKWIGIDITPLAINVISKRLEENFDLKVGESFKIHGDPADFAGAEKLASEKDKYHFENWALRLLNCVPSKYRVENGKVISVKGADGGFDGIGRFSLEKKGDNRGVILAEVKTGKVGRRDMDIFVRAIEREGADLGIFVILKNQYMSSDGYAEATKHGFFKPTLLGSKLPKVQVFSVEDFFEGKKPNIPFDIAGHIRAQRVQQNAQEEQQNLNI